jgi:phosphopantetheine--protein transferase-like protein
MSTSTPLGIDIEKVDRNVRLQSLMGRFFHAEEIKKFLDYSDEERVKHFIHYWTLKESFVKGLGTGMTTSFTSFYLTKESERTFYVTTDKKELQDEYSSWRITSILAPKGFICSVAYRLS